MWVAHGWVFMVYVVVAFLLSRKASWTVGFTILALVAGLIPLLIFWVEHRVTQRLRAEHPELATSARLTVRHRDPMTTAFVLGGGGVLGAVEVGHAAGPPRARDHSPTWCSAPASARSTARWSPATRRSAVDRPDDRAVAGRRRGPRGVRRPPAAHRPPGDVDRHPHLLRHSRCKQRLAEEFGDLTFEELPVRFQVCAASIERAAEHWFDTGPVVDAVVASAAVPGLLPPAKVGDEHYLDGGIVNSIPVGRAVAARRDPDLRAPGRPDRPAAQAAAPAVGGGPGVLRDRPPAPVRPRDGRAAPTTSRRTCCPARGTSSKDDSLFAHRDFSGIQERIDATYEAVGRLPGRPCDPGRTRP